MTDPAPASAPPPAPTPPTEASRPRAPLDEVMLAMDVVDVLRHQRALVEAELDEEGRERALVERVRDLYASQGIEVPEDVVARGVRALKEDRFRYEPPERTLAVRLAEVYVARGWWARRVGAVLLLVAAVWGASAWMQHRRTRALVDGFAARVETTRREGADVREHAEAVRRGLDRAREEGPATGAAADVLAAAARLLAASDERLAALGPLADDPELAPARYPRRPGPMDERLEQRRRALAEVAGDLGKAESLLQVVARLRGVRAEVDRVLARLGGLEVAPAAAARIERGRAQVEAALDAGDEPAAREHLEALDRLVTALVQARQRAERVRAGLASVAARFEDLPADAEGRDELRGHRDAAASAIEAGDLDVAESHVDAAARLLAVLESAYELRIVSRPEERSGVWRHPDGRPDVRNHYVIVDVVGPDGRPVLLDVTSEEDRSVRRVSRFGIRVPESVYEQVKADKLDNGIVDDTLFGVKRRGAREVEYRFAVAGGRITTW